MGDVIQFRPRKPTEQAVCPECYGVSGGHYLSCAVGLKQMTEMATRKVGALKELLDSAEIRKE